MRPLLSQITSNTYQYSLYEQLGQFSNRECSYNLIETFKLNQTFGKFQVNRSGTAN